MRKLRIKLFISLISFALVLVSVINLANRELLKYDMKAQQQKNQALIERHVLETIKTIDMAHHYFGKELDSTLEKALKELSVYYKQNPDVLSWNIDQLKQKYGYEIFIFNKENTIIHTSLKEDLGLNFSECCDEFSRTLDSIRNGNKYYSEGLDTASRLGTVWKYAYYPTPDHKYLLEMGVRVSEEQLFKDFDYVKSSKILLEKYSNLKNIQIINVNKEGYFLGAGPGQSYRVVDQSAMFKKAYARTLESMQPQEYKEQVGEYEITSRLIPYVSADTGNESPMRIAFIQLSNQSEKELLKKNSQQYFILLLISIFTAIVLLVIVDRILMRTFHLATYDSLTGAKNRASYLNEMDALLKKKKSKTGLLLVDLDNFKKVNDQFGHAEGDRILVEMVHLLKNVMKKEGLVVRLGGDEFAIIVFNATFDKLHHFAESVLNKVREKKTMVHDDCWAEITVSVGSSLQEDEFESEPEMFKRADEALYKSKKHGKDQYSEGRLK